MAFGLTRSAFGFCAAIVLIAAPVSGQSDGEKLVAAALMSDGAYETLSHLTDNIGPRLSGSKGADLAVRWTTRRFREWGIDVRNEKVMVPRWVRGAESARLVSHNDQKLAITTLGGSVATPAEGLTAEVIEVRSYEELDALGSKVNGKVVLYNNPMDLALVAAGRAFEAYSKAVQFRGTGASRAAKYGAAGVLVRSVASASLRTPHTGSLRYDPEHPKIPAAAVSVEDAMLISRLLTRGEKVRVRMLLTPRTYPDVPSANVVAEIRGSELPGEIVLIGAHLDSWDLGTGAVDDGSGVAMVMETMRLIHDLGLKPRRTIRAVLFMNEENGLRGGRGYFDAHKQEKHAAAIESDAGSGAPQEVRSTLTGDDLAAFEAAVRPLLARIGDIRLAHSRSTGADTSPLTEAGVTGFGLVPDPAHYFDWHHTAADTLDKIDPEHLAQNAATVAALAWTASER